MGIDRVFFPLPGYDWEGCVVQVWGIRGSTLLVSTPFQDEGRDGDEEETVEVLPRGESSC